MVRIYDFHSWDPGSIPGRGGEIFFWFVGAIVDIFWVFVFSRGYRRAGANIFDTIEFASTTASYLACTTALVDTLR